MERKNILNNYAFDSDNLKNTALINVGNNNFLRVYIIEDN